MKKMLSLFLALAMLCTVVSQTALPASAGGIPVTAETSGICGANLTWNYDEINATLTISGSGEMYDYEFDEAPWSSISWDIQKIVISDGVTSIGNCAFVFCSSLTSVTISENVTSIGYDAFAYCSNLTSVTIPESVTSIGSCAFLCCTSLTEVTIPQSVTSIDSNIFTACYALTKITVAEGNPSYSTDASGALFNKDKTELISFPGGYSGTYTIPDSVISIGDDAFSNAGLTEVTIPESVTSIGAEAFYGCEYLTSITIPESVTNIGMDAFAWCTGLTEVTIPQSVTSIDSNIFFACTALTKIKVAEENPSYSTNASGALFNKDKTELISFPGGYSGAYTVPDSVRYIGVFAFAYSTQLTHLTISDSVTSIDSGAFAWCSNLESVTLPENLKRITFNTFAGCTNLTSVTIPKRVTRIDDYAFESCDNLKSVYFCGDAPNLGEEVFSVSDKYTYEYINNPYLTIYYINGKTGWTTPTWNDYPTATWTPDNNDDPKTDFNDVNSLDWFYNAVNFAVSNNLFNGMGDNKFEPNTAMNRAMLVTVLWRYAGSPKEGTNTFTDVKAGQWYADAVAWASSKNIVGGVGEGKFDPNGNVTREQLAAILFRYCEYKGISTNGRGNLSSFPDKAKVSSWATDAYSWAVGEGLIGGNKINGQTLLDPQGNATRAQVATILMRFIENVVK